MDRIIFLFCFVACITCRGFAQFEWKNPLPQGNDLYAAWFTDENIGYAVGEVGTVMKTINGGDSWDIQNLIDIRKFVRLVEVCFTDPDTGFALDHNGFIFRTTDAGVSWDTIHDEYYAYQNDLFFTNPDHGVVSCDYGQILTTFDGGETWERQYHYAEKPLTGVHFPTEDTGYIAGYYGVILKTTNGGIAWDEIHYDTLSFLNDIYFISPSRGMAAGYSGEVLQTEDGGLIWTKSSLGDSIRITSIGMFNPDTILMVGIANGTVIPTSYPMMMRSFDGGASWEFLSPDLDGYFPRSLFCFPDGTIYAVGYFGLITKSEDFGENWTVFSSYLTAGGWGSTIHIDFPNGETGYAVTDGYAGSLLKTIDSGETWFQMDSIIAMNRFSAIEFTSELRGYIGGYNIYSTFDGGNNWTLRYTCINLKKVNSIAFATSSIGVAVGSYGLFLRTPNIGQSWVPVTTVPDITYWKVCFPDDSTGYASGADIILKTTDAGLTWSQVYQGYSFFDFYFVDSQTGYGVTGSEVVAKTTDGAQSWTFYDTPISEPLWAVHFFDADTGFASGGTYSFSSVVIKTTDGGETWQEWVVPTIEPMEDIVVTENYNVFAGGWFGFLFGAINGGYTGNFEPVVVGDKQRSIAYPNPFQENTTIRFELQEKGSVFLRIYDAKGTLVKDFFRQEASPGIIEYQWDGKDQKGSPVSYGGYFYFIMIDEEVISGKIFKSL